VPDTVALSAFGLRVIATVGVHVPPAIFVTYTTEPERKAVKPAWAFAPDAKAIATALASPAEAAIVNAASARASSESCQLSSTFTGPASVSVCVVPVPFVALASGVIVATAVKAFPFARAR
jgi:hypothetical protein